MNYVLQTEALARSNNGKLTFLGDNTLIAQAVDRLNTAHAENKAPADADVALVEPLLFIAQEQVDTVAETLEIAAISKHRYR